MKLPTKKILVTVIALVLFAATFSGAIKMVSAQNDPVAKAAADESVFTQWNKDSVTVKKLTGYVEDITDKQSKNYIPPEDRIAVFDMDGTLYAELFPTYFEYYMYCWRVLADPDYDDADDDMIEVAETIKEDAFDKSYPDDMAQQHAKSAAKAYSNMTVKEFGDYVTSFVTRDADGFEGMTYGEAYYKPMAEIIDYLNANDFTCYVVSGSDRAICRLLLEGSFDVPEENIIGTDVAWVASGQGDTDGLSYVYSDTDEVVRSDTLLIKSIKMNKVSQIALDIGKQPVLSFGNTSGDCSMHNYTMYNNKYKSEAFMLIADDEDRDYGNTDDAEDLRKTWEEDGYNVISMKNEFKTIYGEDVKKTGKFRWDDELSGKKSDSDDSDNSTTITKDEALKIAEKDADVSKKKVVKKKVRFITNDKGKKVYLVEISLGRIGYKYNIDPAKGDILKKKTIVND